MTEATDMKSVDQPTTIKFTTTVEFTPEQWAKYKDSLLLNYGEEIKTKAEAGKWMKREAEYGICSHLEVQDMNYVEVTIK